MKINIHAGHNPDGKTACGAVGLIKESTEARRVKDAAIGMLKSMGHTVYDCTVNNGTSANDVLKKIVNKCNAHDVDVDVSIHFNAGANDYKGNGKSCGTEVWVYSNKSTQKERASRICAAISELGFRNRGVKSSTSLYVLKHTKAPALLIECCFVDDKDDVNIYNYEKMAEAIVYGITGTRYSASVSDEKNTPNTEANTSYLVKVTAELLNVRSGPGTNYDVTTRVRKGEVFTIVEEQNNWGKLKSGAGWISLKYTARK